MLVSHTVKLRVRMVVVSVTGNADAPRKSSSDAASAIPRTTASTTVGAGPRGVEDSYTFKEKLGSGSYGTVFKALKKGARGRRQASLAR